MRILINHLTRMRPGRICVAGVTTNGAHIRPVLDGEQLGRDLLSSEGGPFSLGQVVDLGNTCSRPEAPEVEDIVFCPEEVEREKMLGSAEFGEVMKQFAKSSLEEIFGKDLVRLSGTAASVPKGAGCASLGVIQITGAADLHVRRSSGKHELRLAFRDRCLGDVSLKVTDLRLWEPDQISPAFSEIKAISSRLDDSLVAVGLTRYFPVPSYPLEFGHWLQVNNIFPSDDPLWLRE